VQVDEQLKKISELDPNIRELQDLAKMPSYPQFYELVKKGNSLLDAFKLANFETLSQGTAARARQAAINAAQSKQSFGADTNAGQGRRDSSFRREGAVPHHEPRRYRCGDSGTLQPDTQGLRKEHFT